MKRKISVLIIVMLLCISSVVIFNIDIDVEATSGGGGGEGDDYGIGLDLDFMWEVTTELANVVHEYPPGMLRKGREFGTWGDTYTADYLDYTMNYTLGLDNVEKLPIGPLTDEGFEFRYYSSKIDIKDLQLHIDNVDYTTDTGWPSDVPKNETFAFPSCVPPTPGLNVTHNYTFDDGDDIRIRPTHDNWPLEGLLTNDFLDVSGERASDMYDVIVGNATYIASNDTLPEQQDDMVFLIEEDEECDNKLENITNASAVILINEESRGHTSTKAKTSNCSVTRIDSEVSNLAEVLDIIENETVFVHNAFNNETLTFIYNLNCIIDWPNYNFVCTDMNNSSNLFTKTYFLRFLNNRGCFQYKCKGIIVRPKIGNDNDVHYMNSHNTPLFNGGWLRFYKSEDAIWLGHYALPVFSVNRSVCLWLEDNSGDPSTTITGYIDQDYQREDHWPPLQKDEWTAGVTAHNVIGNITIDESPGDATILISNRYDGCWSEAAFDSGGGAGIVMGIAKYFKDNSITPKHHLTFLMTTGEEYMFRGAQHFSDNHTYMNYTYWIGFDQLACDFDRPLNLTTKDRETSDIVWAIANETDYTERTTYDLETFPTLDFTGAEEDVWKERDRDRETIWEEGRYAGLGGGSPYPCKTICFAKDPKKQYPGRHKAGLDFTKGDTLEGLDRNDLNVTFEIAWNVTKYFCVNPDSWYDNINWEAIDTDDADSLVDTISFSFDVTSTLPHDLVMINASLKKPISPTSYNPPVAYDTINFTVDRNATSKTINITLPADKSPGFYVLHGDLYNSTGRINEIIDPIGNNVNQTESSNSTFLYPYNYGEIISPCITNVSASPDPVGYGFNVTISADVTSNVSSIDIVTVNITYPNSTIMSFNMTNTAGDTYEFVFDDTWQYGQYDYVIWAKDLNGNESGSSQHSFDVSADVTISVCTIKDSYGNNEIVNLTDPPGQGGSSQQIGYELLDDDEVLRIWNKYDNYFFNTSNGVQFSNHYNEYWSHNVLMLGYYNNNIWNLIYRTDELSGFNKDIECDDETYVNATLWKDLSYGGYDFRLAIRYHLGVDDNELTVIPYIKNIGDEDIPYDLGFAWEINDIQVDMTPTGDYIEINGTSYYLNQELDEIYNNMANPCFYIREKLTSTSSESLYLRWDEDLNDIVRVKSRTGQYNAPVSLGIKIGTLTVGQEKHTELYWHDASEAVYYFDDYYAGEAWIVNPSYMVDNSTSNYANTAIISDVELCINNTCYGEYLGLISKVELRAYGYWSGLIQRDIILRPVFSGGDGNNHYFTPPMDRGDWSPWFDITYDKTPSFWDWGDVRALDCDVESGFSVLSSEVYCSKVEIHVTYTTNQAPIAYGPVPSSGSTGVGIQPVLSINVYDADSGDTMNITWLSNSSGSWQVFGTNLSVSIGEYQQIMSNASVNGQWWYWMVNVSDGLNYTESSVYSFYTGYESKIKNIGSTDIMGYLLMQVQFYNNSSSSWIVALDTINETSPRTINASGQLGLDSVFNGLVNTNSLSGFGNGTYRVYVALRDPNGNVLVCDDDTELIATYEFTITFD